MKWESLASIVLSNTMIDIQFLLYASYSYIYFPMTCPKLLSWVVQFFWLFSEGGLGSFGLPASMNLHNSSRAWTLIGWSVFSSVCRSNNLPSLSKPLVSSSSYLSLAMDLVRSVVGEQAKSSPTNNANPGEFQSSLLLPINNDRNISSLHTIEVIWAQCSVDEGLGSLLALLGCQGLHDTPLGFKLHPQQTLI